MTTSPSISIHAPHTGHDLGKHEVLRYVPIFQSTRPIRGTTVASPAILACMIFQSTRPIRGTTSRTTTRPAISPAFQSTRPIRGTTLVVWPGRLVRAHFNPRAPYGARRGRCAQRRKQLAISIHAPHTGHDWPSICTRRRSMAFQSTRPIRGTTGPSRLRARPRNKFQSTRPIRGTTAKMHNLCSAFLQQQTIKA